MKYVINAALAFSLLGLSASCDNPNTDTGEEVQKKVLKQAAGRWKFQNAVCPNGSLLTIGDANDTHPVADELIYEFNKGKPGTVTVIKYFPSANLTYGSSSPYSANPDVNQALQTSFTIETQASPKALLLVKPSSSPSHYSEPSEEARSHFSDLENLEIRERYGFKGKLKTEENKLQIVGKFSSDLFNCDRSEVSHVAPVEFTFVKAD